MFVEFIKCNDCIYLFNVLPVTEVENHYNNRKSVKRCIGCEKLEKYYHTKVKKLENRGDNMKNQNLIVKENEV